MSQAATDAELLGAFFAEEDDHAFRQIVERYSSMVYRTCLRGLNGDEALAKDACQAVFVLLVRKGKSLRKRQALAAWLYRTSGSVVKNLVREHSRRRKREQVSVEIRAADAPDAAVGESRQELLRAMAELPAKYREPLELHYLDGRKLRDVGTTLGCSEDAARKRVNVALIQLRQMMKRNGAVLSLAVILGMLSQLVGSGTDIGIVQSCCQASMASAGHAAGSMALLPSHLIAVGVESRWFWQGVRNAIAAAAALLALGIIPVTALYARPEPSAPQSPALPEKSPSPNTFADVTANPIAVETASAGNKKPFSEILYAPNMNGPLDEWTTYTSEVIMTRDEADATREGDAASVINRTRAIYSKPFPDGFRVDKVDCRGRQAKALIVDCKGVGSGVWVGMVLNKSIAAPAIRIEYDQRIEDFYLDTSRQFGLQPFSLCDKHGRSWPRVEVLFARSEGPSPNVLRRQWFHVIVELRSAQSEDGLPVTENRTYLDGELILHRRVHTPIDQIAMSQSNIRTAIANLRVRRIPSL